MTETLETLLARREELLRELAQMGDMRPGSISENYRRCGKAGCRCAAPEDPGHGPYYAYTRKVEGKTETINLRPGSALSKIQKEVETYQRFRHTCQQLVLVNDQICDLRPVEETTPADELKKKLPSSSRKK